MHAVPLVPHHRISSCAQIALRIANEKFLREHPQLHEMIRKFVKHLVQTQPEQPVGALSARRFHSSEPFQRQCSILVRAAQPPRFIFLFTVG